jgi:hypothetical protein
MCKRCLKAVSEQKFSELEEIVTFDTTEQNANFWVTRCRRCGQLWETYAYHPSYSQEISPGQARQKYPNLVLPPTRVGLAAKIRCWLGL